MSRSLLAGALLLTVLKASSASAAACGESSDVGLPILRVHTEIKSGLPSFVVYYFGTNEAVTLNGLDKPDIQLLKKVLDDAFAQGKKLTLLTNSSRAGRTSLWLDANETAANTSVTFCDIVSGDSVYLRFK
jgi:hypothetical protein